MAKAYSLYNKVTHETIDLCDDGDASCIAALQEKGYYMLSEEKYGDKYKYPAIYKSPGIVWDQSEENKTNGDWTMTSRDISLGDKMAHTGVQDNSPSDEHYSSNSNGLKYLLYNSKTHESFSIPDELGDSGWVLLTESAYPNYKHPAVYNTVTHTAIDQSQSASTSGDWMMVSKYKEAFTSEAKSIDKLAPGNSVASFRLAQPVSLSNKDVAMCIVGTKGKDKIIGSDASEMLMGGSGKNILKGGSSADGFMFDELSDYGKKVADKIRDFSADEGDKIFLSKGIVGLGDKIMYKSISGEDFSRRAVKSNKQFLYNEGNGRLYFNENGSDEGWGDGGYLAKLNGAPDLDSGDFSIV